MANKIIRLPKEFAPGYPFDPTVPIEMDWSNDLSRGSVSFLLGWDLFYNQRDVQGNLYPTTATNVTVTPELVEGRRVVQAPLVFGSYGGYMSDTIESSGNPGITYIGRVRALSTSAFSLLPGNYSYLKFTGNGSVSVSVAQGLWTNVLAGTTPTVSGINAGDMFDLAITATAGSNVLTVVANGVQQTVTYGTRNTPLSLAIDLRSFLEVTGGWISSGIGFEHFNIYNRALSMKEILQYHENPYQIVKPVTDVIVPYSASASFNPWLNPVNKLLGGGM